MRSVVIEAVAVEEHEETSGGPQQERADVRMSTDQWARGRTYLRNLPRLVVAADERDTVWVSDLAECSRVACKVATMECRLIDTDTPAALSSGSSSVTLKRSAVDEARRPTFSASRSRKVSTL